MTCLTRRPLNSRENNATEDANHEHGLNDEAMRNIRNKAAHDEVLSRDEAREVGRGRCGYCGKYSLSCMLDSYRKIKV